MRLLLGGLMATPDTPLELEVISESFTVTPALAKLLVKLARRHLEWEASEALGKKDAA